MLLKLLSLSAALAIAAFGAIHAADNTKARPTDDGLKIGEAVTNKVGFYGVTPVVQPTGATQAAVTATSTDGTAAGAADLAALKAEAEKIGDDVRAVIVLLNKLRTDLIALGLVKGAAP